MKSKFVGAVYLLAACGFSVIGAEQSSRSPLQGIWQWNFTMPDGGEVSPRVSFRTKDGELTGISRFRAGSEVPLTNIVLKGNDVSFDVVRKYEGETVITHYSGKLSGDAIKGKITSKSNGEEQNYAWDAKRVSGIDGVWKWTVTFNERSFDSRVTLKLDGEKLTGKLAGGRGGDLDLHRGRLKDNHVHFEVERRGFDGEKTTNVYRGTLEGDKITGTYISNFGGRRTNEWNAVRAD